MLFVRILVESSGYLVALGDSFGTSLFLNVLVPQLVRICFLGMVTDRVAADELPSFLMSRHNLPLCFLLWCIVSHSIVMDQGK